MCWSVGNSFWTNTLCWVCVEKFCTLLNNVAYRTLANCKDFNILESCQVLKHQFSEAVLLLGWKEGSPGLVRVTLFLPFILTVGTSRKSVFHEQEWWKEPKWWIEEKAKRTATKRFSSPVGNFRLNMFLMLLPHLPFISQLSPSSSNSLDNVKPLLPYFKIYFLFALGKLLCCQVNEAVSCLHFGSSPAIRS